MTTAEIYRQLEQSPQMQIARYIFLNEISDAECFPLGDVIEDIKTGKTPSKLEKRFYEDDFIDWFKPNEIGSQMYLETSEDKLSKFAVEKKQVTIYEPNTILINAIGDVGRVSILKTKASSNQQITGIKLNDKVIPEFAYYYLVCNRHLFLKDLFQTTLPIINQKKICSVPFLLPDVNSQKKILDFIKKIESIKSVEDLHLIEESTIGSKVKEIAKNLFTLQFGQKTLKTELNHQLALVKELRQAYLREAMQGKLVPQDERDEPAEILLEKIKAEKEKLVAEKRIRRDKPLPPINAEELPFEIPSNWTWCRLGKAIKVISGNSFNSTDFINGNGIKAIKITNAGVGKFIETEECLPLEFKDKYSNFMVYEGDLVIALTRPYISDGLKISICPDSYNKSLLNQRVAVIREIIAETVNKGFVYSYMKSEYVLNLYKSKFEGKGQQPNLKTEDISNLLIPLPPLAEQERIVAKLEKLMKFCDELEANIKQGITHADQLLQTALKEALEPKEIETTKYESHS